VAEVELLSASIQKKEKLPGYHEARSRTEPNHLKLERGDPEDLGSLEHIAGAASSNKKKEGLSDPERREAVFLLQLSGTGPKLLARNGLVTQSGLEITEKSALGEKKKGCRWVLGKGSFANPEFVQKIETAR